MPSVEDYASLAPFTLEELVAASNAILRDRPTLQIQSRTVRFYISSGLLPSPSGGPKYARYGLEHLKRLIAIRQWVDQGMSLEQAADRIKLGEHGGEKETHSRKQTARPHEPLILDAMLPSGREERTVKRIRLTENCILEIDSRANLRAELELAAEALKRTIERIT